MKLEDRKNGSVRVLSRKLVMKKIPHIYCVLFKFEPHYSNHVSMTTRKYVHIPKISYLVLGSTTDLVYPIKNQAFLSVKTVRKEV